MQTRDKLEEAIGSLDDATVEAIGSAMRWAMNYGSRSVVNPHRAPSEYHETWQSLEYLTSSILEARVEAPECWCDMCRTD